MTACVSTRQGIGAYVVDRCRCTPHREVYMVWKRDRDRQKKDGTWEPFVSELPVIAHLLALRAVGWTMAEIAAASGVSMTTISRLFAPGGTHHTAGRVRTETADLILCVDPGGAR